MSKKKPDTFQYKAKKIPTTSGCYLFYDKDDTLLYVGKAKNLRKRVSNYFQKNKASPKTRLMVSKITQIETRSVQSEMEALILENNLIKEFRPRFNVLLRDDKNFLYLRITNEAIPKIEITRRIIRDGSFYFGPKTSAKKFRTTINFCQKVFQIRTCKLTMAVKAGGIKVLKNPENRKIPCMDFHVKKCSAPCANELSTEQYQEQIELMKRFLRGDTRDVLAGLQKKMMNFAEVKNFEAATKIRDLIHSIEASTEKQTVQFTDLANRDFIHFHRAGKQVYFVRIAFRRGKFLDQNEIVFHAEDNVEDGELLEQFLLQFYERVDEAPEEIHIPEPLQNAEKIQDFLAKNYFEGTPPVLHVPQRGDKKKVLSLAAKNAKFFAEREALENLSRADNFAKALPELGEALALKEPPSRMECFDISHFAGNATVASQVVFVDGAPKKSEYRRFKITSLPEGKIDDFAAMKEVLSRRFKRSKDKKFAKKFPQLIVIDGGKGQLSSVMQAVEEAQKDDVFPKKFKAQQQIIALAKQEEEIFRPGNKTSLRLPRESAALRLLQRIRDEAHRFAISYNRSVRQKTATQSILDEIPGIGTATKKKLLRTFESVSGIQKADDEELKKILSKKQLENLRKFL